nr:DUF3106 domain-containing protein [Rhodoferax sp.]
MPVTDLFARIRQHLSVRHAVLGCMLIGAVGIAVGQAKPTASKPSVPVLVAPASGQQWQDLTATQKKILQPLASTWNTLSSGHKGKWIALSQSYATRSPAEQEKMQSRMVEWAALTPSQRERARLNFAETKKVPPSTRAAEWETYQGLSSEEKRDLATKGKGKPTGAAVAVTPVPPSKLIAVPITRHTSPDDAAAAAVKPRIDPNTLLLLPPVAPAPAPAPAPIATPSPSVPAVSSDSISPN